MEKRGGLAAAPIEIQENLLGKPSGIIRHGYELTENEVLRFVHDFFGHGPEGHGFGPRGEFNALLTHLQMFPEEARPALLSELFMQSAWYFANRSLRRTDGSVPVKGDPDFIPFGDPRRQFADPKNLLPSQDLMNKLYAELGKVTEERPEKFQAPEFKSEIEKVRNGESFGQTFTKDGKVWKQSEPSDIVTLASVNVPKNELTDTKVKSALEPYDEVLDKPGIVSGVFELDPKTVSVDVNAAVPQAHRENSIAFAKANDQKAIWDADKEEVVDVGGSGKTLLNSVPEILDAAEKLVRGEPVQFAPKKRKDVDPLKFGATSSVNPFEGSKAWILPNGKVEQLGSQWHHAWLDQNKAVQEKYGLKIPPFEGGDAEGVREQALRKGFARVNLAGATLVVEARQKDWKNIRPIVEDLIERNIDDIDKFRVNLLNDKIDRVTKSYAENLFDADSNKEKMGRVYDSFAETAQGEIRGGQFQPSSNPRAIKSAAIRDEKTGEIHSGSIHPQIIMDLLEKAVRDGTYREGFTDDLSDGFITNEGEFLGREAAAQRAFEINQLKKLPEYLGLESRDFEETRQFQPKGREEQEQLFGGREYVSPASLTQEELRARYPEAIVPRNSKEKIASNIIESPLYKKSADPVKAFADKLVEFANQHKDNPIYQLGLRWYSDFAPLLKKEFGKDAGMMAELLAASSPNEKPDQNFYYAVDAMEGFKSGRFDKIVKKFNEGFDLFKSDKWLSWYNRELNAGNIPNPPKNPTPEAFLAHWIYKHNLKPRQSNGQLFGFHGRAILEVFARKWLEQNEGPKVANFVQNLQGTGHEATIDVWADRTMRRIGYQDDKPRWRILPANGEGVSDADFAFAQKAFRAAAEQLGIKPDALQGGLWFAEKQLWADNGWGRLDLGSYVNEMEKLPMIRQAIKQRLSATAQRAKIKPAEEVEFELTPRPTK